MGAGENGEFLYAPERPGLQKLTMNTQLAGWYVPMVIFVRPAKKVSGLAETAPYRDPLRKTLK